MQTALPIINKRQTLQQNVRLNKHYKLQPKTPLVVMCHAHNRDTTNSNNSPKVAFRDYFLLVPGDTDDTTTMYRDTKSIAILLSIILQGLVVDVAVVTSCRHAALSCAHRLADARPMFITSLVVGPRSVSTVLSQVCLGRLVLRLHSTGGPMMQAWRAR